MPRILVPVVLLLLACAPAAASELAGTWAGTWIKARDALPVAVTFDKNGNGYSGSFDSDSLEVAGIPFADVSEGHGTVHFVLKGDTSTTTFSGLEANDAIDGTFTESSTKGTFHLVRSRTTTPTFESRDVAFSNGDVKLAGTIFFPKNAGPHPAVLFLHGSGPEGRFANRWLAQKFVQAGFVALITDKRGVGQSTGNWKDAGPQDLAGDAVAGIRLLQSLSEVDSRKVGLYGHSQGGTLAPLVAVRAGGLAFVIASAAGGIDPAAMEEYSVDNSLGTLPPEEAAEARVFVKAIVDVAYRGHPRAELDTLAAKFRKRIWYFDPPPPSDFYWQFSRRLAGYEPAKYWKQVKAPVLLLYGNRDERVPPKADSEAIVAALHAGGNTKVTLRMFSGADHIFTLPGPKGGWTKHVPDYAETMTDWANANTLWIYRSQRATPR